MPSVRQLRRNRTEGMVEIRPDAAAGSARDQLRFLRVDFARASRNSRWRRFTVPFTPAFAVVLVYRLERAAHLRLGRAWPVVRALLGPARFVVRPWLGTSRIHYEADIGPGLTVLHAELGLVVGGCVIGRRATFAGGNVVGVAHSGKDLVIAGDGLELGTHSQLLGPLTLGDDVTVGAGAVVLHDHPTGSVLVGVPASAR